MSYILRRTMSWICFVSDLLMLSTMRITTIKSPGTFVGYIFVQPSWPRTYLISIAFKNNLHPLMLEHSKPLTHTLRETNIAMETGPFEDVSPIKDGDFPASHVSLLEGIW